MCDKIGSLESWVAKIIGALRTRPTNPGHVLQEMHQERALGRLQKVTAIFCRKEITGGNNTHRAVVSAHKCEQRRRIHTSL